MRQTFSIMSSFCTFRWVLAGELEVPRAMPVGMSSRSVSYLPSISSSMLHNNVGLFALWLLYIHPLASYSIWLIGNKNNMDSKNPQGSAAVSITIPEIEGKAPAVSEQKRSGCALILAVLSRNFSRVVNVGDTRRLVHAAKVGLALVLVSLLYMLEVVHDRLGDNAIWAVMTVVVVFEFTAGKNFTSNLILCKTCTN